MVPLHPRPSRIQQAPTPQPGTPRTSHVPPRPGLPLLVGRPMAGLHPHRVRTQPPDPTTLRPARMGLLRILPLPLPHSSGGLRLHLIATPSGLPIAYALTPAAADERDTCTAMIEHNRLTRPAQTLIADKGYRRAGFEQHLQTIGITLIRPTLKTEPPRPHQQFLKPFRQIIESIIHTLKTQLGLERHGARTKPGVTVRVLQRLLALTAVIWHNETTQQPGPARSLTPYDH